MGVFGFFGFFGRLAPTLRAHRAPHLDGIHSAKVFCTLLERERACADRNDHVFSIVAFNVGDPDVNTDRVQHVARVLASRRRSTDEAGWLDDRSLGILLRYTSTAGACRLANDVCYAISSNAPPPKYTVYTYPDRSSSGGKSGSRQHSSADLVPQRNATASRDASASPGQAERASIKSAPMRPSANTALKNRPFVQSPDRLFLRPLPAWKRAMDVVGAAAGLILFSPLLLAAAVAVRRSSTGPIIFGQERAGYGGRPFTVYKFRTMFNGSEAIKEKLRHYNEQAGPVFKIRNDPRITSVGQFLRKTSIDELPQLWNVLKGDMSLVGPRPLPCEESDACTDWQRRRLDLTPGITGIWQVSGRCAIRFDEWARMDIYYAQNRSPAFDTRILLSTLPAVLSGRGAC